VRHPVVLSVTLFFIVVVWCACALALDPSLDVNQYSHTAWKVREGFPKSAIFSIGQTTDGYLWLGTDSGLFRFDGVRATPWRPPGDQQLPSNFINSLLGTRDGTLWIGTNKGLVTWNGGKFVQYPDVAGFSIRALLEDREGTVWIGGVGSTGGKLCAVKRGAIQCFDSRDLGLGVLALCADSKGTLWLSATTGLWQWAPGIRQRYPFPQAAIGSNSLAEDENGLLLIAVSEGLQQLVRGKIESHALHGLTGHFWSTSLLRSRDGSLWIGSRQGLFHFHAGRVDVFKAQDGLSADFIDVIFEDREGNVWIGTQDGLDRFRDVVVTTISRNQGLSNSAAWSLQATPDGSIWIGTADGLNRWKNGEVTLYRSRGSEDPKTKTHARGQAIATKHVSEIANSGLTGDLHSVGGDQGRLWVSTSSGIFHLEGKRFIRVPGVPSGNIFSIANNEDGSLWIVNNSGLIHLTALHVLQQIPWSRFGGKHGFTVLPDRSNKGAVWLGFFEGGLVYFDKGQVLASYGTADGFGNGKVSQLRFGSRGALWASTEGGLSRIKDGRIATLTNKNGIPCDAVHWSIEDDDHAVWLSTACGLLRIERSELDAWVRDSKYVVKSMVLDVSDGARNPGVSGGYPPTVTKSPDGRIWFLPRDGVSVIDPHRLPINKVAPPVHIEKITADGETYDASKGLSLPARVRDLSIDYTALSLVAPEKIHFRYKLEGQDPTWRQVVNVRQVQYSNLAARHYTFRVMACNNSGVWNEAGATLDFVIPPAWYQTNWFRAAGAVAFLTMLWGIYRLRILQMRGQFAIALDARVNERTRIARELHDTLLQNFHGLMFQFQAASTLMLRRPDEAKRSLDDAISETKKALAEGRDAIQGLRSEPIAKGNLAELLTFTSQELAGSSGNERPPAFDLIEEGDRRPLSSTITNDVCRIALELMRNAYQHAHAQRIEAEIRYGESMFRLRIRDNGQGIEPKVLKEGGKSGHWGLRGLRERADRIGARLDVWSEPGSGTEVQLLVPASIAYDGYRASYVVKLVRKVTSRAQRS